MTSLTVTSSFYIFCPFCCQKKGHFSSIHLQSFTTRYLLHVKLCRNKSNFGHLNDRFRAIWPRRGYEKLSKGPITWRIFSPGWNFSLVNRVETSARLLQQILLKSNCRLHGEVFSLGRNSARAENPSPLCSCSRCHFDSPETLSAQFHIFGAEANMSARAEVRQCNRNKISAGLAGLKFQPGLKFPM